MMQYDRRLVENEKKTIELLTERKPSSKYAFAYCHICNEVVHGLKCPVCGVHVTK
jgi:recombinational DNA repair protein RecR